MGRLGAVSCCRLLKGYSLRTRRGRGPARHRRGYTGSSPPRCAGYPRRYLCLAGGSSANVRLIRRCARSRAWKTCNSHPGWRTRAGPRRGAGLVAELCERPVPVPLRKRVSRPAFSDAEIEAELRARGLTYRRCAKCTPRRRSSWPANRIVARFAGRMEYVRDRSAIAASSTTPRTKTVNDG